MKIRLFFFLVAILPLVSIAPSSAAEGRYALVIGNSKYPDADAPLKQPVNDARELAAELRRDGFDVDLGENLTGNNMRVAFDRLYAKLRPGSVALIFFSGFGIQSNRVSYMIPVDAQIWTEQDVRHEGFNLEAVLSELNSRGAGVKIALMDASRRNPYERRFRTSNGGLAPVISPNDTLVMYSAALSSVVSDSGNDSSLFTQQLLREIRVPGLMAEQALNRVREGVTRTSRGEQIPWISSSLAADFSFVPGSVPPSTPLPMASAPPPPAVVAPLNVPAPGNTVSASITPPNTQIPAAASTPQPQASVAVSGPAAPLGRRVALIVGNSSYKFMPKLQNPRNDAADVEIALKGLGFETVMATDLDLDGMGKAISRFARIVRGADVAIVYYSGHGMQFNGKNYLLPTDANLESAADVDRYHVVPLDELIQMLGAANDRGLQLIVLDACRNNPAERDFKNKLASAPGANRDAVSTRGFARVDGRDGLIIAYATAPNEVAADGTGRNSPFTQAFLKDVAIPDLDVRQMLFKVQYDVYQSAKQRPEISTLYVGPEVRLKTSQK